MGNFYQTKPIEESQYNYYLFPLWQWHVKFYTEFRSQTWASTKSKQD